MTRSTTSPQTVTARTPDRALDRAGRPLVALVTGASSGVGELVVRELRKAGHEVWAVARRTELMRGLESDGAHVLPLDLTDPEAIARTVARIEEEAGRIDVLVNVAGYGLLGPVEHIPLDEARRQFEVNLFGLADLTARVLPGMRARGTGRIVNVTSIAGTVYEPLGAWYHASKAALDRWSDCLRVEVAPFGIRVVTVRPSGIRTEWRDIAQRSLRENTRGTAYGRQARGAGRLLGLITHSPLTSSPPAVVAADIARAALDRDPSPIVPTARGAQALMNLVTVLPAPVVDAVLVHSVRALSALPARRR